MSIAFFTLYVVVICTVFVSFQTWLLNPLVLQWNRCLWLKCGEMSQPFASSRSRCSLSLEMGMRSRLAFVCPALIGLFETGPEVLWEGYFLCDVSLEKLHLAMLTSTSLIIALFSSVLPVEKVSWSESIYFLSRHVAYRSLAYIMSIKVFQFKDKMSSYSVYHFIYLGWFWMEIIPFSNNFSCPIVYKLPRKITHRQVLSSYK